MQKGIREGRYIRLRRSSRLAPSIMKLIPDHGRLGVKGLKNGLVSHYSYGTMKSLFRNNGYYDVFRVSEHAVVKLGQIQGH